MGARMLKRWIVFPLKDIQKINERLLAVEQDTIALCDGVIEIPQLGMKHSLNVATAAGVVLWELVRSKISV
jgi:tRNA(Leu) C34 or U34 (ribose-2'-O)-methylase TrmL